MKFLKLLRVDFLYLLILSITTFYIWYPLTNLILQWESYTYITKHFYLPLYTKTLISLGNFDVQSMLVGSVLAKLIGTNIPMYFWVEIISILLINICVYILVKTLTQNSFTGFVASFLFAVYFFGIGFFTPTYYATFLQRIIFNVPLLLMSFLLLHRYLDEHSIKLYKISLLLFFVSIFIARFGILLSFPILLYPVFWNIIQKFSLRSFFHGLIISSPFIAITIFFLQIQKMFGDTIGPKEGIFYFLTHPGIYHYVEGAIRQLVYMSQYPTVIQAIRSTPSPFSFVDATSTYTFALPIMFSYVIGIIVIWLKNKKQRALLLTVVSSIIISLILNIYFERFDVYNAAGMNRYYYYPSILVAIFWSLFLTALFNKRYFFVIVCILFGFFLLNATLFRQYFSDEIRYADPPKKLYEYIINNNNQFPSGSFIIIGPTADFGPYETNFLTDQLGRKRNIVFTTEDRTLRDWKTLSVNYSTVLRLKYNKICGCVEKEILR